MTREEAARRFSEKMADPYYVPRLRELYQMAADALSEPEIIRCKDCIWWHRCDSPFDDSGECVYMLPEHGCRNLMTYKHFFCAYGERRQGNEAD